ncbi:hypothetical protein [Gorillibacterium sp. CAU 1737]|uniref:hypothetical protein n=1 Tax=Gorillibacterium sp. CAU 1737 TaxID=3140362 RepID=UPI0032610FC2
MSNNPEKDIVADTKQAVRLLRGIGTYGVFSFKEIVASFDDLFAEVESLRSQLAEAKSEKRRLTEFTLENQARAGEYYGRLEEVERERDEYQIKYEAEQIEKLKAQAAIANMEAYGDLARNQRDELTGPTPL